MHISLAPHRPPLNGDEELLLIRTIDAEKQFLKFSKLTAKSKPAFS